MDLPKRRGLNEIAYSDMVGRQAIPEGACQKKVSKSRIWAKRWPTRRPAERYFNMLGECRGKIEDVMDLGIQLAREAIERGDREFAEKVIERMKRYRLKEAA